MCGFLGEVAFGGERISHSRFEYLLSLSKSRGPNETRIEGLGNRALFGFNRLSVLDLTSNASQPMWSPSKRYLLMFNGEIYNRHELKQSLKYETRSQLTTTSDTEIFLEYISEYGLDRALHDAEGMFGFSLQDLQKNELYLCVDKFGQKPIYYGCLDKAVYYSSDFKSF